MNNVYFEVKIKPSGYAESFENFLFDFGVSAVEEENDELIVRIEDNPSELIEALNIYADELSQIFNEKISLEIASEEKANSDWIETFQNSIEPVSVGSFWIRPSWREAKDGTKDLIIDPALAFGTGHHASTRGVLTLLEKYGQKDKTLLDIGTGSGILAIAASKIGIVCDACDTDGVAVDALQKNAILNNATIQNAWVGSASQAKKEYDIVLANIVADIILLIAKDILKATKLGGIFILSGIVENRQEDIKVRFADCELLEIINEEGWATVAYRKK